MLPLALARIGQKYTVVKLGGNQDIKAHLEDLGFTSESTVMIISSVSGNLIVNVKESRIGISNEMALKIIVKEMGE